MRASSAITTRAQDSAMSLPPVQGKVRLAVGDPVAQRLVPVVGHVRLLVTGQIGRSLSQSVWTVKADTGYGQPIRSRSGGRLVATAVAAPGPFGRRRGLGRVSGPSGVGRVGGVRGATGRAGAAGAARDTRAAGARPAGAAPPAPRGG